jgi:hypothetical protein
MEDIKGVSVGVSLSIAVPDISVTSLFSLSFPKAAVVS